MQRALLFLFLVLSVMISLNKNVYGDDLQVCPYSIEKTGITSCSDLCNYIAKHIRPAPWAPFSKVVVQSAEVRPVAGQGVRNQSLCTCHFQGLSEMGVVVWDSVCDYQMERTNPLPLVVKGIFGQGNVVDNFVKAALFMPVEVKGDNRLNTAFKAVQNIYIGALQEISDKIALILLVMIFGFSLARFGVSNLFQVLRGDKQESWGIITSADLKNKALQVALALTFFMFPLPASTVLNIDRSQLETYRNRIIFPDVNSTAMMLRQCGAEWDRYIEAQEEFSKCLREYQESLQIKGEKDVFTESSEGMYISQNTDQQTQDFFSIINNIINIIQSGEIDSYTVGEIIKNTGLLGDFNFYNTNKFVKKRVSDVINGISYCYDEWQYVNQALNDLHSCFVLKGVGTEQDWDKFVFSGIQDDNALPFVFVNYTREKRKFFGLPLAVAVVKGFVDYGVRLADKLSKKANAGLLEYLTVRISDEKGWFRTGLEMLKHDEGDLSPQVVVSNGACKVTCSEVLSGSDLKIKREHPECIPVLDELEKTCSQYNRLKQEKINSENIAFATDNDVREVLAMQVDTLEKTLGWLSTGMVPMVGVFAPVLAGVKEESLSKTYATLQSYKTYTLQSIDEDAALWTGGWKQESSGVNSLKASYEIAKSITDSPTAFLMGMGVAYTSFPPGSWFRNQVEGISGRMMDVLMKSVSVVLSFLFATPISVPAFIIKTGGKAVGMIATSVLALLVLKIIPYLGIIVANLLRFIAFLFEIIKTILTLPFWGAVTATTRADEALNFFKQAVRLMFIPCLIVASTVFAFFAIEAVEFFIMKLPLTLIFSAIGTKGVVKAFTLGILTAFFVIIVKFLSVYVGFMVAYSFPEKVIESVSAVITHREGKEIQIFQSPAHRLFRV